MKSSKKITKATLGVLSFPTPETIVVQKKQWEDVIRDCVNAEANLEHL